MAQEKSVVPKVPTGSMYIGICTTRAQAIAQRWQATMVLLAVNSAVGNMFNSNFNLESARSMYIVGFILLISTCFNVLWYILLRRSNKWIDYFTERLKDLEQVSGTESGETIFSNSNYPSIKIEKGESRTSSGIVNISKAITAFSGFASVVCFAVGLYLNGQGKW